MATSPKKKNAVVEKVKRIVKPRPAYSVLLEVNGEEYKASGATAIEAIHGLGGALKPFLLKTKCFLWLKNKNRSSRQLLLSLQLKRFVHSRVAREIWAKRLESRLA